MQHESYFLSFGKWHKRGGCYSCKPWSQMYEKKRAPASSMPSVAMLAVCTSNAEHMKGSRLRMVASTSGELVKRVGAITNMTPAIYNSNM